MKNIRDLARAVLEPLSAALGDACEWVRAGLREYSYLAGQTALRLRRLMTHLPHEELEQAALVGVWLGLASWDGRGTLKGWLIQRARWAAFEYAESCCPAGAGRERQRYWRGKGAPLRLPRTVHLSRLRPEHGDDHDGWAERCLADAGHERERRRAELREEVDRLLDLVPAEYRDLLRRHHLDGDSKSTIARDLGCSSWAVSLRLQKAWRCLRHKARLRELRLYELLRRECAAGSARDRRVG